MSSQTEEANHSTPDFIGFHLREYDVEKDVGIDIVEVFETMIELRDCARRLSDITRAQMIAVDAKILRAHELTSPSYHLCYLEHCSDKLEKKIRRMTRKTTSDDPKLKKLKKEYDELQEKIEKQHLVCAEHAKLVDEAEAKIEVLDEQARACKRKMDEITSDLCRIEGKQQERLRRYGPVRQNLERRQEEERQWLERKHQLELQWLDQMDESNGAELPSSTSNESK